MHKYELWVVVPFYNEAGGVRATLDALEAQIDRKFTLLMVDNASTDSSDSVIRAFAGRHPDVDLRIILEPEKGTGAACDTGFRYAIAHGARFVARTDADCLPRHDWVGNIRRAFHDGEEFVVGRIRARNDDYPLRFGEELFLQCLVGVAAGFGRIRAANRGAQYRCRYVMTPGNNLAITADLYTRCGGFPRTRIEEEHEDRALVNRVRTVSDSICVRRDVVVFNSIRRVRSYGWRNTLLWYWDHRYQPTEVDVR